MTARIERRLSRKTSYRSLGGALAAGLCSATMAKADLAPAPTVKSLTTCSMANVKTIKIGILAALTGPLAVDTNDMVNAAKIAMISPPPTEFAARAPDTSSTSSRPTPRTSATTPSSLALGG